MKKIKYWIIRLLYRSKLVEYNFDLKTSPKLGDVIRAGRHNNILYIYVGKNKWLRT